MNEVRHSSVSQHNKDLNYNGNGLHDLKKGGIGRLKRRTINIDNHSFKLFWIEMKPQAYQLRLVRPPVLYGMETVVERQVGRMEVAK